MIQVYSSVMPAKYFTQRHFYSTNYIPEINIRSFLLLIVTLHINSNNNNNDTETF